MNNELRIIAIPSIPLIKKDDKLGEIILNACRKNKIEIDENDVLVIVQKVISKAEGATVNLNDIKPSSEAIELSRKTGRDAELCQVYIDESRRILGTKGKVIITEHKLGYICTSAGVDRSNVGPRDERIVSLLPKNPDKSARDIREYIKKQTDNKIAVIISDSFGKPDREGCIGVAIGIAGIAPIEIQQKKDLFGNEKNNTIARIDELAAAASILVGQSDEKFPAVLIKGAEYTIDEQADIKKILIPQ
jgi:coenzyme F420-0:L-glutamate ligase/coenzyme F420-1:gamma-L-glutamate ligase